MSSHHLIIIITLSINIIMAITIIFILIIILIKIKSRYPFVPVRQSWQLNPKTWWCSLCGFPSCLNWISSILKLYINDGYLPVPHIAQELIITSLSNCSSNHHDRQGLTNDCTDSGVGNIEVGCLLTWWRLSNSLGFTRVWMIWMVYQRLEWLTGWEIYTLGEYLSPSFYLRCLLGGRSWLLPRPPCTTWEGGGSSRARGAVVGVATRWVWGAKANLFITLFHRTIQMVMVLVAILTFIDIDRGHHGGRVEARKHHRLGRHGLQCSS